MVEAVNEARQDGFMDTFILYRLFKKVKIIDSLLHYTFAIDNI